MKRIQKIKEVCTISGGYAFKSNDFTRQGIPIIRIGDISGNKVNISSGTVFFEEYNEKLNKFIIEKGDILVALSGATTGKFGIYDEEIQALLNQRVAKISPKENINNKYLYHYMNKLQNIIYNKALGCAQPNISPNEIGEIEIYVPSRLEQDKISDVLDIAKDLIDKRKKQIEELDLLVKSKFIEMFGSENSIFEKWETVNIGAVSEVGVGVVIKPADYYTDKENGIKTFRSLNVGEMKVKDENWVYFSKEGNEKNKKSILKKGQILIVRSGYPGTACVVTEEYEGCNAIDVIIATPNNKKINSVYMCAFTNYRHGKNQILEGQAGAAQKHFNVGAYKNMKIALPPLEEQEKFELFLKQVDKLKFEMEKSLKELENNFNSLMNKAFKGELF